MNRFVVCLLVAVSGVAHANPAAEKAFQDGRAFMVAGKLAEACDAFRRSQDLEPRAGTLLNLANCEEKRGRIATAWEAFVESSALAKASKDTVRAAEVAAEADKRAAAIASKLPYLTVRTPATKPPGFSVTRDGKATPTAELDHEIPVDPAKYDIEASAPGHITWKQSVTVGIGAHASIEIPALTVDPSTQPKITNPTGTGTSNTGTGAPTGPTIGTSKVVEAPPANNTRHLGIGPAIGFSTDGDLIFGGRAPLFLAAAGPGSIRAVASFFYADINYSQDPSHHTQIYAPSLSGEYVAPVAKQFTVAAGVGLGVDFVDDNYEGRVIRHGFGMARLSPTIALGRSLDLGLHVQAVVNSNGVVGLAELGVDYFFW